MSKDFILSPAEKKTLEPLIAYLTGERVEGKKEVVINRPKRVGFEAYDGTWAFEDAPALDVTTLGNITRLLAELNRQAYSIANPILSCRLPGGHRAQIVGGDQIESGFSLTVRLHQQREFDLSHYDMSDNDRQAIESAVKNRKNILISGGTGSGKTSFMNAVIKFIPQEERLVTLEDVRELKVEHENACLLVFGNAKPNPGESRDAHILSLLNATLRMRPDRILLGEIRKENAFTFISAINTGHAGSMATIHANDPKTAIDAVINRVMLNGDVAESALATMRRQLGHDIYGVVQLERVKGGVKGFFEVLQKEG